jgi:hypothetical protein
MPPGGKTSALLANQNISVLLTKSYRYCLRLLTKKSRYYRSAYWSFACIHLAKGRQAIDINVAHTL